MKKVLFALSALIGGLSFAQKSEAQHAKTSCSAPEDHAKAENFVMLYKGKMMKVVDGKPSPLTEAVKLNNGAKVNVDGSVNLPDGKVIHIKENEMVTMSGKMSMYTEK